MGLEESPHCPFDVMEACRTGVRRDYHQPGWESSRPTAWPPPIRDRHASRHLLQPPYSFSELRLAMEGLSALNLAIEGLSALIGRVWSDPPLSHGQWLGNGHLEEFGQHLLCLTGSGWEKGPPRHRHQ